MELDNAIKTRRSIRKYACDKRGNPEKVDIEAVIEAINAARYTPMAGNLFSVRMILVSDKEKIKKIADASQQDFIADAAYVIVVCTDGKQTERFYAERAERYLRQQAGAAIQTILLKITEAKLASVWVGHFYDDKIREILDIPPEIFVEAILPVAKPASDFKLPEKRLTNLRDILYFDKWKGKPYTIKIPKV
ncbi:MAG: nitroreductase family protein [Candidatus Pacearchaeota archaeon]